MSDATPSLSTGVSYVSGQYLKTGLNFQVTQFISTCGNWRRKTTNKASIRRDPSVCLSVIPLVSAF